MPRISRLPRSLLLAVAAATAFAAALPSGPVSAAEPGVVPAARAVAPDRSAGGVLLGTVGGVFPSQDYGRVTAFQGEAGRTMASVRVYASWDSAFPDPLSSAVKAHGQVLVLSVKARTRADQVVPYRQIAAAAPGTATYAQVVRWARAVRAYGAPVMFSFNHEPDVHKSDAMGTAAEYVAAWRRVVTIFRQQGVRNAEYVFIATAPHYEPTSSRAAARFYPGDAWVDDIAADGYNFATCRTYENLPWIAPEPLFAAFQRFGQQHPTKGLVIAEFGSVEDPTDPGRKAEWLRQLQALLKTPGYRQLRAVANWYDAVPGGRCNWRIDSSPAAQAAFRQWGQDPQFGGVGLVPPSSPAAAR